MEVGESQAGMGYRMGMTFDISEVCYLPAQEQWAELLKTFP